MPPAKSFWSAVEAAVCSTVLRLLANRAECIRLCSRGPLQLSAASDTATAIRGRELRHAPLYIARGGQGDSTVVIPSVRLSVDGDRQLRCGSNLSTVRDVMLVHRVFNDRSKPALLKAGARYLGASSCPNCVQVSDTCSCIALYLTVQSC